MEPVLFIGFLYFFFDYIIQNEKEDRKREQKRNKKK